MGALRLATPTKEPSILTLQGAMPHIIEFFPGIDDIEGENPEFFAIHIWRKVKKDADDSANTEATTAYDNAVGLFGTFLVLQPGSATPTTEIQRVLEQRSQAWSWEGTIPPSPHIALLTTQEAQSKDAFFEALLEVLCKSEPTARDQIRQRIASILVARFFKGNADKVMKLATWVSHQAKFGGPPSYSAD